MARDNYFSQLPHITASSQIDQMLELIEKNYQRVSKTTLVMKIGSEIHSCTIAEAS